MRFSASIPRRSARPPPGFGGRRPARGAQEGRARVEGALAVQQGEDAVVLRERPEGGVVRFLLGQERQHLRFRDADRGGELPRSGRAAGLDGGRAAAARRRPKPKRARSGARRCTTSSSLRRNSSRRRLQSRAGAKARGYLADRGIEPKTQLRFRIGYAPPERFALKEHLGAQGISAEDMIEAGLLVSGEDIPVPYDRFRDRVMFPITDLRGRVIAFGGRALDKDAPAKYLNSPETPLFHKGATLYNGAAARQAAHQGAPIVVGRGLCRRDRDGDGGLRGGGRAARHRAHRRPARAAVEDGRRAGALLRRRRRGPSRRLSRGRPRAAAHQAGQDASNSRCCPKGRTRTIWCAPADARRSAR